MYLLARMLLLGEDVPKNVKTAKELLTNLSMRGEELYCWSNLYLLENEVEKKRRYCLEGSRLRDFRCLNELGTCF